MPGDNTRCIADSGTIGVLGKGLQYGPLAQLGERRICTAEAAGSNPARSIVKSSCNIERTCGTVFEYGTNDYSHR